MAHRDDIQGLRGVAVLLVVLNHSGISLFRGGYVGVDVFFVLSGFLITGILLAQAAKRGSISLTEFYARRARRILPAAALTLVVTDLAAYYLLNFVRARETVSDSLWAAVFAANVHFAREGTDYFAQGQPASPLQHFWTLAVEEQFYLVWPAVVALVLFGASATRRFPLRSRRRRTTAPIGVDRLLVVIVAAAAVSLAWSIQSTAVTPDSAYFSTFARAWELALGAALTIAAARVQRLPGSLLVPLGWLGLVGIVAAGILFSAATPFPGYAALLPAIGSALVIGAGIRATRSPLGVARLLGTLPLRYVGDRSYAFYLWHWPVLVIALGYAGHELSVGPNLLLLCGAFLLSTITYRFFENPIRRMRGRRPIGIALWPVSAALVGAIAVLILGSINRTADRVEAAAAAVHPAQLVDVAATSPQADTTLPAVLAAVRAAERADPLPSPLTPPVSRLRSDLYSFPDGCTPTRYGTASKICRLGDTTSRKTIVVLGDSHAQMWMPTILSLARRDGWLVIPLVKVRCIPRTWTGSGDCGAWYRWAKRKAQTLRPDVALIIGSRSGAHDPLASVGPVRALGRSLKRSARSVIILGDAPDQNRDPVDCLLAHGATMKTCSTASRPVQLRAEARVAANARADSVGYISTLPWFCARPRGSSTSYLCPLVINQTITSMDLSHISATYALELAGPFRTAFRRELFR